MTEQLIVSLRKCVDLLTGFTIYLFNALAFKPAYFLADHDF